MTAETDSIHMKVSKKNPIRFYIRSAMSFLKGAGEDKPAVENLVVSGLGNAINVVIACASRIEAAGLGTVQTIKTDYVSVSGGLGKSCPQIEISIKRSPNADKVDEKAIDTKEEVEEVEA